MTWPRPIICDYIRTPIGRFGGALSSVRADDLGAVPLKALVARNPGIDWEAVDDVIYRLRQPGRRGQPQRRAHGLLLAGLPQEVSGTTINRLCGSGMDAVIIAARAIKAGEGELMIAGGVEIMSRAPFVMPKAETAFSRNAEIYDTTIGWRFVNPLMKKQYGVDSMPETGENVAEDFSVAAPTRTPSRVRSQDKAVAAQANGRLAKEIVPVTIPQRKGEPVIVVDKDEHPRADTTLEALAKLPTPFRQGGTVTAGNASGVNDGAAALIVASEAAAKQTRPDADRPHPRRRGRRRAAAHHGHRPGAGDAQAVRPARPDATAISTSSSSTKPSPARHRRAARTRHRRGRRRTSTPMAAPSRSAIRSACPARASPAPRRWSCRERGGQLRARHHVHRRRPGHRHRARTRLRFRLIQRRKCHVRQRFTAGYQRARAAHA